MKIKSRLFISLEMFFSTVFMLGLATAVLNGFCLTANAQTYNVPELMYYKFDGTGTAVPNLASSPVGSPSATITGAVTQGGTGQFGGGLIGSGNSSTTDFLNTGWATNLGTGSWTISLYLNGNFSGATLYYFFGDVNAGSFRCFTNGVAGANNLILRGGGLTDVLVTGGAPSNTPTVTHFVYNSTTNQVQAYVNGVLVNTVAQGAPNITGAGPFKVMGYAANVGSPAGGVIDEFRIYNRALSGAEIAATWNISLPFSTTAASVTIGGKVLTQNGRGISNAIINLTNSNGEIVSRRSNNFGYYNFEDVQAGETYIFQVRHKSYSFSPQVITVTEQIEDLNFVAEP